MAFARRLIGVTISLADVDGARQSFAGASANLVKLPPLRTSCKIAKAGGLSDSTANIKIFGMAPATMKRLSTFGMQINLVPKNPIVVTAYDEGSTPTTVFTGYIVSAYIDFQGAPEVAFNIYAHTGFADAIIAAAPSSFKGTADVATIMSGFATKMGKPFENNGVTVRLANQYYYGSVMDQAKACVRNAGISWNGGDGGVVAIWPKNGSRGGAVPLISKATGMIGYPTFNAYGIALRTVFNPALGGIGQKIEVASAFEPASGTYTIYSIDHDLDAMTPGGQWQTTLQAYNPKYPTPVPDPVES